MNILFIGPYLQKDGWGHAAKNYVRALTHIKHNVTIRPISMCRVPGDEPTEWMTKLEVVYDHYDVVIQNVLPHYMDYNGRFKKNIGLLYTETGSFNYTAWPVRMNHMDEMWVPSQADADNLLSSGVTVPIKQIPIPIDISKFQQSYEKLPLLNDGSFKFYFIGEYNQRKNLAALIRAFHSEFHTNEPVSLVIKTYLNGLDSNALLNKVSEDINKIKDTLRIYRDKERYKKEVIIVERLSELDMCRLHNTCDCFVMPSRGESLCMPAMDALGFGKTPIVTNNTGMTTFVNNDNGWLINSIKSPVFVSDPPFPDLYTSRETWFEPDILSLRKCMREAYNSPKIREGKAEQGIEDVYKFSYENIAKVISDNTN